MRSGAQALALLAAPLNPFILRGLAAGPKQQTELLRETGSPAQTTLRAQLKRLARLGVIEKRLRNAFPGVLEYELAPPGHDLLYVVAILERWLERAPASALPLGDRVAKAAIKALIDGWSTTMLRALATRALTLTQLDHLIAPLSYPSLERRLTAMRLAGQVEACPGEGRGTPYAVTTWLRAGMAPLVAAARWEQHHQPAPAPFGRSEIEAILLLTMPLLRVPPEISGTCRLAMAIPGGSGQRLAGVTVDIRNGHADHCATKLNGHPGAWALGSPAAWLDGLIECDATGLELGGDCLLARTLIDGVSGTLFPRTQKIPLDVTH